MAEKNKENLFAVIDRIDKEQITMEPKMLTDAKNALSKMKWETILIHYKTHKQFIKLRN